MSVSILRTTENAWAALVSSASVNNSLGLTLGNGIYTGIDNSDKNAPMVVCYGESATEVFPFSGIYNVKLRAIVKEMASDTTNTSSLANTIFSASLSDNTQTILNQYPGFYCYSYWVEDTSDKTDVDAWEQEYVFNCVSALKQ